MPPFSPGEAFAEAPADTVATMHAAQERRRREVALGPGDRVGRYVIAERVGSGGMGVVFAASDPELDRRVAIKVLLPSKLRSTPARERLLAEARALAQLNHPNVVAIYDVGRYERSAFIAMDFVEGRTLAQWRRDERPQWRATVEMFVRVGRGLAAVHRAGLVHRDIKPENLMIGRDGRVVVMDFGLARHGVDSNPSSDDVFDGMSSPEMSQETREGGLVGTPAYLAPEQHAGLPSDARSDQFSFCVALYETLWGEHPFASTSIAALALAVTAGNRREPPRVPIVPARLRQAVLRGLAARPHARHESMDALVAELEQVLRRPWRIGFLGTGLVLAAAIGGTVVATSDASVCSGAEERLHETWDPQRAAAVERALRQTDAPYANEAWAHLRPRVDAWAEAWVGRYREACRATRVDAEQTEKTMDLRIACLDRRRAELAATIDVLLTADDDVLHRAGEVVDALPDLRRCDDVRELASTIEPPASSEARAQAEAIHDRLARVRVLVRAGRYDDARTLGYAALADAETLAYRPLLAQTRFELGVVLHVWNDLAAAERALEDAYGEALATSQDAIALAAATKLVRVVGGDLARHDDGSRWAASARALLDRIDAGPVAEADLLDSIGLLEASRGRHRAARDAHARALALRENVGDGLLAIATTRTNLGTADRALARYEQAHAAFTRVLTDREAWLGPSHPEVAIALQNLGTIALDADRTDEAIAFFERALAIRRTSLGERHAHVAASLHSIGIARLVDGDLPGALEHQREALAIWIETLGPDHHNVARARTNLAVTLKRMGRLSEALEHAETALRSEERALGADHPSVGMSHGNVGTILDLLDRRSEALAHLTRAHEILEATMGARHPAVGRTRANLAILLAEDGRWDDVLAHATAATEILEASLGARHGDLFLPLSWQGRGLLQLARPRDAIAPLERAVDLLDAEITAEDRAATHLALAHALWDGEGDHTRARVMAEAAFGDADPEIRAAAHQWLVDHPEPRPRRR